MIGEIANVSKPGQDGIWLGNLVKGMTGLKETLADLKKRLASGPAGADLAGWGNKSGRNANVSLSPGLRKQIHFLPDLEGHFIPVIMTWVIGSELSGNYDLCLRSLFPRSL